MCEPSTSASAIIIILPYLSFDISKSSPIPHPSAWIIGIRDVFAHQYSNIDFESAWDTIQHDLPELEKQMRRILESIK